MVADFVRLLWVHAGRWVAACCGLVAVLASAADPTAADPAPRPEARPQLAAWLTVEEAEQLVADDSQLVVSVADVRSLEPEVARVLARCESVLVLSGLTELTPEVAAALAACPGVVDLSGLRSLTPAAAEAMKAYRGPQIDLSGMHPIPPHVVELGRSVPLRLDAASFKRWRKLTVAEAELIVRTTGWDGQLPALRELTPEVAAVLVRHKGEIEFSGLQELAPEVAEVLVKASGKVRLPRLAAARPVCEILMAAPRIDMPPPAFLWPAIARAIAEREEPVRLDGVISIDAAEGIEIARALARKRGGLALPALRRVSPRTLSALLEKQDIEIPSLAEMEFIPEADGTLDDFVVPEQFEKKR